MTENNRIFLSHASADKSLADLLRNTLILGGVPESRLFYSSDRATGIPSGQDVGTHLQKSLRSAALVIELISERFLTRPMCLMELGGAWALGIPTYPIVVPPLSREQAITAIGNVQMGRLGSDQEISDVFDEMHDRLAADAHVTASLPAWSRAVAGFRTQASGILSVISAAVGGTSATKTPSQTPDATDDDVQLITFANTSVVNGKLGRQLHTEVTNRDVEAHSVMVKATLYNSAGEIVGTADGIVNQLGPGATKTLTITDIPTHVRRRLQVDALI